MLLEKPARYASNAAVFKPPARPPEGAMVLGNTFPRTVLRYSLWSGYT